MNKTIVISNPDGVLRDLVECAFPNYTGKKFAVRVAKPVGWNWCHITSKENVNSSWALTLLAKKYLLSTFEAVWEMQYMNRPPINGVAKGIVAIERIVSNGKDLKAVVHVAPDNIGSFPYKELTREG